MERSQRISRWLKALAERQLADLEDEPMVQNTEKKKKKVIKKIIKKKGGVKVSEVLVRPGGEREEMMQSSPYVL
mgnify:CR=1 FL=1